MRLTKNQLEIAREFEQRTGFDLMHVDGGKLCNGFDSFDDVLQENFEWLRQHTEDAIRLVECFVAGSEKVGRSEG